MRFLGSAFFTTVLTAVLLVPQAASAQVEIGIDAELTVQRATAKDFTFGDVVFSRDDDFTDFSIPKTGVRVGFFTSPTLSIEFDTGFGYRSVDGDATAIFELGAAPLFHFSEISSGKSVGYVGPRATLSIGEGTDIALGAKGGVKIPANDHILMRIEGFYERFVKAESGLSTNVFGVAVGFSYLMR